MTPTDESGEDHAATPFWSTANKGIIGLGPAPWRGWDGELEWPTEGYDGPLRSYDWDKLGTFAKTKITKAEWLALADMMIARWQDWRTEVQNTPDDD